MHHTTEKYCTLYCTWLSLWYVHNLGRCTHHLESLPNWKHPHCEMTLQITWWLWYAPLNGNGTHDRLCFPSILHQTTFKEISSRVGITYQWQSIGNVYSTRKLVSMSTFPKNFKELTSSSLLVSIVTDVRSHNVWFPWLVSEAWSASLLSTLCWPGNRLGMQIFGRESNFSCWSYVVLEKVPGREPLQPIISDRCSVQSLWIPHTQCVLYLSYLEMLTFQSHVLILEMSKCNLERVDLKSIGMEFDHELALYTGVPLKSTRLVHTGMEYLWWPQAAVHLS